jgi:hypothetical protein
MQSLRQSLDEHVIAERDETACSSDSDGCLPGLTTPQTRLSREYLQPITQVRSISAALDDGFSKASRSSSVSNQS